MFRISIANEKGVPVAHPTWGFLFVGFFYPLTVSYEKTFKFNPHEVRTETMCVSLLPIHLLFSTNEAGTPICRYCEHEEHGESVSGVSGWNHTDTADLFSRDLQKQKRPGEAWKEPNPTMPKTNEKIEARQSDLAKVNMGY